MKRVHIALEKRHISAPDRERTRGDRPGELRIDHCRSRDRLGKREQAPSIVAERISSLKGGKRAVEQLIPQLTPLRPAVVLDGQATEVVRLLLASDLKQLGEIVAVAVLVSCDGAQLKI